MGWSWPLCLWGLAVGRSRGSGRRSDLCLRRVWRGAKPRGRWWDRGRNNRPSLRLHRRFSYRWWNVRDAFCHRIPRRLHWPSRLRLAGRRSCSKNWNHPRFVSDNLCRPWIHLHRAVFRSPISDTNGSGEKFPLEAGALVSVVQKLAHRRKNMLRLRQDNIFELGLVGAEGVHGGHALDRGVEFFEKFIGNAGGDFGAETPAQHIFIGHDYAVILAHGGSDGVPIVGRKRAKIDDLDRD